jgi:Alginate lyase.
MKHKIVTVIIFSCVTLFMYGQNSFMHPKAQIEFVKSKLKQKDTRFTKAYEQLINEADSALSDSNHALEDFSVPGYYVDAQTHMRNSKSLQIDAFNAYACALVYRLGGAEKYGKKACDILNVWAKVNKKYSDGDGSLVMSYSGNAMMMAAQLMSETDLWGKSDRDLFKQWVINVYQKACNEIRNRTNNWADWGRFGSLLCAVYLNDTAELNENIRLVKSDLFHKIATDGSMPEETRRQGNGIWYTYFSLAPITGACWIIYNASGDNIFTLEKDGVSIKKAIDYLLYHNQHPEEWKWFENPRTGPQDRWPGNLLEAMYGIYNDERYVEFVKNDRPLIYPEHHFAWSVPTLMPLSLNGYK